MVTKLVGPFQVSNPFEKYARPSNWIMNPQFSGSENSKKTLFFFKEIHTSRFCCWGLVDVFRVFVGGSLLALLWRKKSMKCETQKVSPGTWPNKKKKRLELHTKPHLLECFGFCQ